MAWPDDLVKAVLGCDRHYKALKHAKNALDKMLTEGHIQASMKDHEIISAAQVYAKMRTAQQINAPQDIPPEATQQGLGLDTPEAPIDLGDDNRLLQSGRMMRSKGSNRLT